VLAQPLYLTALKRRIDKAIGNPLLAVYLTGSAAVGAFRDGQSDLDVIVVVDTARAADMDAVVAGCRHSVLPCPASKLELVVYERAAAARPGASPRFSLNFDTGPGLHQVDLDPAEQPAHWFVLDLAFAHRHAKPLKGPPAADLIGDPGEDAVRAAFEQAVAWYAEHEPGEPARIASLRASHWERTGEFAGKAEVLAADTKDPRSA
jgi:hypothetical protein